MKNQRYQNLIKKGMKMGDIWKINVFKREVKEMAAKRGWSKDIVDSLIAEHRAKPAAQRKKEQIEDDLELSVELFVVEHGHPDHDWNGGFRRKLLVFALENGFSSIESAYRGMVFGSPMVMPEDG